MRLHHLIQYSCCRFCSHLLLAKAPRDNRLFAGRSTSLPRATTSHGGESQHFWAVKCQMKENQSPYFSSSSLPRRMTMPGVLWEPTCGTSSLGKISMHVLPHCTDIHFRRRCTSSAPSHSVKKQDLQTAKVTHPRP